MFCALQYHLISMWRLQVSYITIEGMKFWDRFYPNSHQQTCKKQRFFVVNFVVCFVVYSRPLTILLALDTIADMGTARFFFYPIQLSLKKFWFRLSSWPTMAFKNCFKSTHDSKWFSGIWFKLTYDSNGFQEFGFKLTHDSKSFPEFWLKSARNSKGFPEVLFKSTNNSKTFLKYSFLQLMSQLYHYYWDYGPLDLTWFDVLGLVPFNFTWRDLF